MHFHSPYRRRRARICAAMRELTRHAPASTEPGPMLRRFDSGPLTVIARERGPWLVLEAWLHGEGRVACFRTQPQADTFDTLSWRPALLDRWEPVVDFELGVRAEAA